ncbi:hypothetical protein [Arthrobacter sp. 162MFSha1.1]|uniref:hypothetical protein n=1 Tax=Arthrobacter sp. 162MFSha1.1 TaxID=1151119 RepID=UPI00037A4876|nr:hypothetical protein [Arthrobacter sp. 162MFSha1.1]
MLTELRSRAKRPPKYMAPRFRYDEERGWFVVGPPSHMQLGPVKVFRKNGTSKTVVIKRLEEPYEHRHFMYVDGFFGSQGEQP